MAQNIDSLFQKKLFRRTYLTIAIIMLIWIIFFVYSNQDLSKKREYVFFDNVTIGNSTFIYNDYIINNTAPIYLPRGDKAILLLHGLGGTPIELKELAQYLADKNITVFVPLMRYQGRHYSDIGKINMDEIYSDVFDYYVALKENYKEVYVAGLSTGGLLTLKLAENQNISGVITYATPMTYGFSFLGDSTIDLFKALNVITPNVRRIEWGLSKNESIGPALPSFDRLPIKTLLQGEILKKETKSNLKKITSPILILQSKFDNRAAPSSAQFIFDNINSENKELIYLNNSGHIITMDFDKTQVFEESFRFIK